MEQDKNQTSATECRGGVCKPWKFARGCPPCLFLWGGFAVYVAVSWLLK